jgi:signal transduction histidine kinase
LIVLFVYSWRRRSVPGAAWFAIGCLFSALWVAGYALEAAAVDVQTKITWFKFQGAWSLPVTTALTCFVLEYTWPGRWLNQRVLTLLSIPCLLAWGVILTDDLFHLGWRGFAYEGMVIPLRTPINWALLVYGYTLVVLNFIVLAWLFLHSPQHRWPVVIMLTGQVVGRGLFLLETARMLPPGLHLNLPPIAFESLMYAIALFGFRILDPIPLARQAVIAQMREGVLVLDHQGRVADLNPAAERILGISDGRLKGRSIEMLLPASPDGQLDDPQESGIELSLGAGPELRHYTVETSALTDWRGLTVGRLLLLHDVTAQKRAQAHLLEQQRALAMLQERERLARELHDSLGQTLAAANMQASTARLLLARGETVETDECLETLAEMTKAAVSDVREYLLGAKTLFSSGLPFFPALRQYAQKFSQQYRLRIELSVPPQLEAAGLGPAVEMQLQRVIQESLSNIRKHTNAETAQIIFTTSGERVQVAICDDGQGFDQAAMAAQSAGGFGLQSMRERAEELGGCLEVISQPGQGTKVVVEVPVDSEQ